MRRHKFFKTVNFDEFEKQKVDLPTKPVIDKKKLEQQLLRTGVDIGQEQDPDASK